MTLLDPQGRPFRKAIEFVTHYGRRGRTESNQKSPGGTSGERTYNRAERRAMRNDLRAYRVAAAKARDKAYGAAGLESPSQPISDALRKRGLGRRWVRGDRWLARPLTRGQRRRRARLNRRRRQASLLP